jgi:hypothetical protein
MPKRFPLAEACVRLFLSQLGIDSDSVVEAEDAVVELRGMAIKAVMPDITPAEATVALRCGLRGT